MKYIVLAIIIILILTAIFCYSQSLFRPTEHYEPSQPELILFYTEWCGYSRSFLPVWDEFAKQNKQNVKLTKLRCEGGDANTCLQKGVSGYPTVILYKNNQEIPFEDDRTVANLQAFLQKHL